MQAAKNLNNVSQIPHEYKGDTTSLLSKYDIPITHLDFSHVEKCEDRRELEKILHVLRSGEEGYYPELMKTAEDRLRMIYPKSKFLRNMSKILSKEELENEEYNHITKDLHEWIAHISRDNKELALKKSQKIPNEVETKKIRECNQLLEDDKIEKPQKIKSTDYAAWDKYDVDTEILKMDIDEEKLKNEGKEENSTKTRKKQVKFNVFPTQVEAKSEANEERQKGNEYFRARDYDSALKHYSASVVCFPTIEALNNRAMTYLKLTQHENAIKDCDFVLSLDHLNLKAHWRKAIALEHLEKYENALKCIEQCVDIDPNNEAIQNLANTIRKKCNKSNLVKRRILVEDATYDESKKRDFESDQSEILPIPGTSRMPEPHYIVCKSKNDSQMISNLLYMKKTDQEVIRPLFDGVNSCNSKSGYTAEDYHSGDDVQVLPDPSDTTNAKQDYMIEKPDDTTMKRKGKKIQKVRENLMETTNSNDKYAGGEPFEHHNIMNIPEDIHSPFTFLRIWNSIRNDTTLKKHAAILRNMNMQQIVEVIGCKLDNNLFSLVLRTLCTHFTVPGELEKIHSVLLNFARLPRFQIISMFMSIEDRNNLNMLLSFLQQHDKILPENILKCLSM